MFRIEEKKWIRSLVGDGNLGYDGLKAHQQLARYAQNAQNAQNDD